MPDQKCFYCGGDLGFELPANHQEGDEYFCERCAETDGTEPEPDDDDTVHACPDCEHPNQFGELCHSCASERGEQPYA